MTPEDALHFRALGEFRAGRNAEAIALFRELSRLQPNSAEVWHNFGVALKTAGMTDEAIAAFRRVIELNPGIPETHSGLAILLAEKRLSDEARRHYRRAIELNPDMAIAHWNYALELLVSGDLEQGWPEFEWRLEMAPQRLKRDFSQPRWTGQNPRGKTILLHAEGGFGDTLQFIRYAPMVADRGATVILECQPELLELLKRVCGISSVFARGQSLPPFDWQIPLQSLPGVFGTKLETIPAAVPYISAPKELIANGAIRLPDHGSIKVGLAWAGSGAGVGKGDQRSRSLAVFAPLSSIPGIEFYGLQTGPEADDPAPPGMRLVKLGGEFGDFADSAAVIANLDLVISVDTSIAHLAGALARPVWTLIPASPDFRWLRDRPDSPWYPTMRLFRRQHGEQWINVVERMAAVLGQWIASKKK
jgi:hypothetical protein